MQPLVRAAALYLLVLLLAGTSPLGTEQGAHLGQVLHPVFAHHMASDHGAAHHPGQPVTENHQRGPAVGAGAGAAFAAEGGIALAPPLPVADVFELFGEGRRLTVPRQLAPMGRLEAPVSPPPRSAG